MKSQSHTTIDIFRSILHWALRGRGDPASSLDWERRTFVSLTLYYTETRNADGLTKCCPLARPLTSWAHMFLFQFISDIIIHNHPRKAPLRAPIVKQHFAIINIVFLMNINRSSTVCHDYIIFWRFRSAAKNRSRSLIFNFHFITIFLFAMLLKQVQPRRQPSNNLWLWNIIFILVVSDETGMWRNALLKFEVQS